MKENETIFPYMMRKASTGIKEASYDQGRGHFLQAHIKALGEEIP